jgi:single stranded DNA-binding protein
MNRTMIIGNLGKDSEVKIFEDGRKCLNFSVAISEKIGTEWKTKWYNCSIWNEKIVNSSLKDYLKKGSKVFVEGRYEPAIYEGLEGSKISHNLMVRSIELVGATPITGSQPINPDNPPILQVEKEDDDLPF